MQTIEGVEVPDRVARYIDSLPDELVDEALEALKTIHTAARVAGESGNIYMVSAVNSETGGFWAVVSDALMAWAPGVGIYITTRQSEGLGFS